MCVCVCVCVCVQGVVKHEFVLYLAYAFQKGFFTLESINTWLRTSKENGRKITGCSSRLQGIRLSVSKKGEFKLKLGAGVWGCG
jgi:hypothetical protein